MDRLSAKYVADAFVKQYYPVLNKCPEDAYRFYKESSLLGWPGPNGVVMPVTTLSGIKEKIVSSDYAKWSVEVKSVDAQKSLQGGIVVAVTGFATGKDIVGKNFSQMFFLATQDDGFFVLNDILRVFDVCGSTTNTISHDIGAKNQVGSPVPNAVSEMCDVSSSHAKYPVGDGDTNGEADTAAVIVFTDSGIAPTSNVEGDDAQKTDRPDSSDDKDRVENADEEVDLVAAAASDLVVAPPSGVKGGAKETNYPGSSDTKDPIENGTTDVEVELAVAAASDLVVAPPSDVKGEACKKDCPGSSSDTKDPIKDGNTDKEVEPAAAAASDLVVAPPSDANDPIENGIANDVDLEVAAAPDAVLAQPSDAEGNAGKNTPDSSDSKDPNDNVNADEEVNPEAAIVSTSSIETVLAPPSNVQGDAQKTVETGNGIIKEEVDTTAKIPASTSSIESPSVLEPTLNIEEGAHKISYASVLAKGIAATSSRTARIPSYPKNVAVAPPTAKASTPVSVGASKISTPSNVVSTSNATAKVAINRIGTPNTSSPQEAGRSIYLERLPFDIDKQGILEVVMKFGPVSRSPQSIQIRRHKDGFCCGLVEFESADSAGRAVEARSVNFGEKQAYISYKRSANRGHNARRTSPLTGPSQSRNLNGRRDVGITNNGTFQNKIKQPNNLADECPSN
ncbi:Nuclear transport factor 2 [Sesamum alatum]|uniref:Nuclear transport factor 2 n=1 Tax=Sesamum alatum TaxID=300844 RepID=A0AAE2CIR8_9LAMI|nr:Nuclear transport factor 2 [Sesamum alatum]